MSFSDSMVAVSTMTWSLPSDTAWYVQRERERATGCPEWGVRVLGSSEWVELLCKGATLLYCLSRCFHTPTTPLCKNTRLDNYHNKGAGCFNIYYNMCNAHSLCLARPHPVALAVSCNWNTFSSIYISTYLSVSLHVYLSVSVVSCMHVGGPGAQ